MIRAETNMKWKRQINGYWLAQGKNGNFLIWFDDGWHARYLSSDGLYLIMVPRTQNFILIKKPARRAIIGNRPFKQHVLF